MSKKFFNESIKLLAKRDYIQASEKLWGATAQMLKAVADKYGWRHDGHAELFKVVEKISMKFNDQQIYDLFMIANSLHTNFYEHWLTPRQVKHGSQNVESLLIKLGNSLISK